MTNQSQPYTEYHPRWFRPHVSTYWWIGSWRYLLFILRELSSVAVAWSVGLVLLLLRALRHGPDVYVHFLHRLQSPWLVVLNVTALAFLLLHTITWFNLAPRAMPVRIGGKRIPDFLIAAPNFGLWIVASIVIAWFVLRPS